MNKQEIIEEFRATVLREIEQDYTTEEEIVNVVVEKFNTLRDIFAQNGVNPQIIDEYMDGNLSMIKAQIRGLYDTRKADILDQVDFIIKKIHTQMEETPEQQEPEEKRRMEQRNIDEMSLIETDNNAYARRIAGELADSIADIRSHANRVLDSRGIDMQTMENLLEDIRLYINRAEESSGEEIDGMLDEDRNKTITRLTSQYEAALEEIKQIENKKEEQSEEKAFRNSLDAGISLEEQNKFAVQWAEVDSAEKEEEKPALGEDIELN